LSDYEQKPRKKLLEISLNCFLPYEKIANPIGISTYIERS